MVKEKNFMVAPASMPALLPAHNKDPVWLAYLNTVKPLSLTKEPRPKIRRRFSPPLPLREGTGEGCIKGLVKSSKKPAPIIEVAAPALSLKTERALSRGEIKPDAKLDLHGLTQAAAYEALRTFLETSAERQKRTLLVVTGKGSLGKSVLREYLPRWCSAAPLSKNILVLRPAAPKHGGAGAFYVVLKKGKKDKA
jgi:DNA-nicking Smr family endonuclease